MSALLALVSALCYGTSDFAGGAATRRLPVTGTLLTAQTTATVLVGGVVLVSWPHPRPADLVWGAAAGMLTAAGGTLLYRALARGPMTAAAPVSAVLVAGVPLVCGLFLGERPGVLGLTGAVCAITGVVLVSRPTGESTGGKGRAAPPAAATVTMATGAGLAFGALFVVLSRTRTQAGLVPLLVCYALSALTIAAIHAARRPSSSPQRPAGRPGTAWSLAAVTGVLEALAHICYIRAAHGAMLSIVAVLSSLYPAATVVLARLWLGEHFNRSQRAGLPLVVIALCQLALAHPAG